jgi:opacity protein-like surface antigen
MVSMDRDLNREWRVGFRGGYNMRSAEDEDVAVGLNRFRVDDLNRDQSTVAGNVSYRFTSEISVRAEYRFSYNTFTNEFQDSVYNHSFFVTLSYDGEPRFLRGL